MTAKKCAKCDADFNCNANGADCWCENQVLTTDILQYLKENYVDCLCVDCLKSYATTITTTVDKE